MWTRELIRAIAREWAHLGFVNLVWTGIPITFFLSEAYLFHPLRYSNASKRTFFIRWASPDFSENSCRWERVSQHSAPFKPALLQDIATDPSSLIVRVDYVIACRKSDQAISWYHTRQASGGRGRWCRTNFQPQKRLFKLMPHSWWGGGRFILLKIR